MVISCSCVGLIDRHAPASAPPPTAAKPPQPFEAAKESTLSVFGSESHLTLSTSAVLSSHAASLGASQEDDADLCGGSVRGGGPRRLTGFPSSAAAARQSPPESACAGVIALGKGTITR